MMRVTVSAIAAIGKRRELGRGNKLLWRIPDDLGRFRSLTMGHPIIMGRKTFESILKYNGKPLAKRMNIVVTRDRNWTHEGVVVANSIEDAIACAKENEKSEAFVIGGAQIYEAALPFTDRLRLTIVEKSAEADSFFPAYEKLFTKKLFEEKGEWNGIKYRWVDLEK